MSESTRAAERFRRSMAAAAAKPIRLPRPPRVAAAKPIRLLRPVQVASPPSCPVCDTPMVLADRCDSCGCGILPGQHVFSVTDDGFQVLCYDCKDSLDDEEDWDE